MENSKELLEVTEWINESRALNNFPENLSGLREMFYVHKLRKDGLDQLYHNFKYQLRRRDELRSTLGPYRIEDAQFEDISN